MKFTSGQFLSIAIAIGLAVLLIYDAPFQAATAIAASASQVVFAPIFDPPLINGAAGRVDLPLLLLELAFVVFVGGMIFFATGQQKKNG